MSRTVYLCDDEEDVRGALSFLLRQHGFEVVAHASGPQLLAALDALPKPVRGVFLLDMRMDPMPGPELHEQLIARGFGARNPVIFLSGHGDVPQAVAAMNRGAINFVEKPPTDETLVDQLERAFALESAWQAKGRRCDFLASLWQTLTPQQRRVAVLVTDGHPNKVIAARLEVSERMVEVHRSRVFERLGVDSAAALATTMADMRSCGIDVTQA